MFGLFKKKPEPQIAKEEPYEPEKPVRELFDAVKDSAEAFRYDAGDGSYPAIRFEFMGKKFGAFKIYSNFLGFAAFFIRKDFDVESFDWMIRRELNWLFCEIEKHLSEKEKARKKAKRQEFIDALCSDGELFGRKKYKPIIGRPDSST